MNILFIYLRHSEQENHSTLTKELSDEFHRQGHNVTVATLLEAREKRKTQMKKEFGYNILRVRVGNYFNTKSKIEKGLTVLSMPFLLEKGIKEKFKDKKIDLILTHTPFVCNHYLIKKLKEHFNCTAYLHLYDIFPQNAKDLEMITNPILYKYFEKKEKKVYEVFDYIGCMSKGNLEYVREHFSENLKANLHILKNWAELKPEIEVNKKEIREKYGYSLDDFICVFGGNMGKPQKLENILSLAEKVKSNKNIKFLFVGTGTEKKKLEMITKEKELLNIEFLEQIPREDYEKLTTSCDVGLVSLDERFTVPNFPSKTTDYFKLKLPILASLDACAAKDYGVFLQEEVKGGLYAQAGNTEELSKQLLKLYEDRELREELGRNGRKYYEENLGVDKAYETIMKIIKK